MPKFLSYYQLVEFYKKQNCRLDITKNNFIPDVTKNKVPYYCHNNHHIINLTKNNFNARINQGLGPCAKCSIGNRREKKEQRIREALEAKGCQLVSLVKRKLTYICSCGKECQNWDNNILKECFTACNYCTNPFNNPVIQERIKETMRHKYGVSNIMHHKETVASNVWDVIAPYLNLSCAFVKDEGFLYNQMYKNAKISYVRTTCRFFLFT